MTSRSPATRLISLLALLLLVPCYDLVCAQLSAPVAEDGHVSVDGNKFLQNQADLDNATDAQKGKGLEEDEEPGGECPLNVQVKWMSQVSSSVYATPLITDLYSDGRKDIIVPSFVHYLEVLEGPEGAQAVGWPAFHKSSVHASPLLYDFDFDGVRDILLATYDGQVLFFKDTGEKLAEKLDVPRLRVRKAWFKGLNPDPNDHSHPDVTDDDAPPQRPKTLNPTDTSGLAKGDMSKMQQREHGREQRVAGKTVPGGDHQVLHRAPKEVSAEVKEQVKQYLEKLDKYRSKYGEEAATQLLEETERRNQGFYDLVLAAMKARGDSSGAAGNKTDAGTQSQEGQKGGWKETNESGDGAAGSPQPMGRRRLMQADGSAGGGAGGNTAGVAGVEQGPSALSDEAVESFEVFQDEAGRAADGAKDGDGAADGGGGSGVVAAGDGGGDGDGGRFGSDYEGRMQAVNSLDAADAILDTLPEEYDELGDSFAALDEDQPPAMNEQYDEGLDLDNSEHYDHLYHGDYIHASTMRDKVSAGLWQDEQFVQAGHHQQDEFVWVDAHVLTTPALADIDADGHEELVLPVSYFFDREYYEDPAHAKDLKGIDIGKYVASGVVVFDLRTRRLKWEQHLDLSTDSTTFKAYAYASPTLIDFDKDGRLEVVMGTSMGFLYVLEHDGKPRPGWPIQMGEIQGQALVLDINNDGKLEVVAVDTRGNVAAFNPAGEELWSRHVHSLIAQGVTAGDINGDGDLELVFGTGSGHVYAVRGVDGLDTKGFPFRTRGRVHAPVLITRLLDGPAQHAIVPSFDGYLYMIDGTTGCADTIDIGESSYSMVLADDLDGNGRLDLVLATMNGNIYALETPTEFHPLKAWPAQVMGPNGMMARHDYFGVYAAAPSRQARDVAGDKLHLKVVVLDKRGLMLPGGALVTAHGGPYNVSVVLKGVGIREMNAGPQPVIGVADTFVSPGAFPVELPCPRTRTTATVHIEMVDAHGHVLTDEFPLSFHLHFHKLLKWMVVLPPVFMALAVVAASSAAAQRREEEEGEDLAKGARGVGADLPTFHPHQV